MPRDIVYATDIDQKIIRELSYGFLLSRYWFQIYNQELQAILKLCHCHFGCDVVGEFMITRKQYGFFLSWLNKLAFRYIMQVEMCI